MNADAPREQRHPRRSEDRAAIDRLLEAEPTSHNLGELARLRIRYRDFPGEPDLRGDLDRILQQWHLSEAELFARTRQLHRERQVYRPRSEGGEDWS